MSIEIKVPVLPESVADATIATWHVQPGEQVSRDQNLVDIETDKVVLEVVAPEDGSISELLFQEGDTVLGEQVIANFVAGAVSGQEVTKAEAEAASPAVESDESNDALSPSVRRLIAEHNVDASQLKGSGVGGRITKEDVEAFVKSAPAAKPAAASAPVAPLEGRSQKRVPMTRLRKTIANRLLEAKNSTAMLTTFNEVNMQPIMDIRKQYQEIFEKRHGIRLGFMSFYVKAVTEALKRFPEVNASIDGDEIVYHNYFDVSIAVSTPRGLVTPVLRDTDTMSLAEIEKNNQPRYHLVVEQVFQNRFGMLLNYPEIKFLTKTLTPSANIIDYKLGRKYLSFNDDYTNLGFKTGYGFKVLKLVKWLYLAFYFIFAMGAFYLLWSMPELPDKVHSGFAMYILTLTSLLFLAYLCIDESIRPQAAIDLMKKHDKALSADSLRDSS